jgi:hypothetical protein
MRQYVQQLDQSEVGNFLVVYLDEGFQCGTLFPFLRCANIGYTGIDFAISDPFDWVSSLDSNTKETTCKKRSIRPSFT